MIGDAAYCPTPFTGAGCAMALVGAYVLAGEISRHAGHAQAFAAFESLVRPYAEATQKQLNPTIIRMFHPRSRSGIALAHWIERLFAGRTAQMLLRPNDARRAKRIANDFVFPEYTTLPRLVHGHGGRTKNPPLL